MNADVTAIIQARMTSSRLPGKIMYEVMGRPLLSYQIERLRFSRKVNSIILATTVNGTDDAVARLAEKEGVKLFRGAEHDVLDRYYQAGKLYNVKNIIRLTSDCPLIQPTICDLLVSKFFKANADYAGTGQSFAEGLDCEIFTFSALEQAWKDAGLIPEREHVTLYFRNHPDLFKTAILDNETDDSSYRITVDEEDDFIVVKAVIEALYQGKRDCFDIIDIKSFLDTHPEIYELNAHIIRNEGLLRSLQG